MLDERLEDRGWLFRLGRDGGGRVILIEEIKRVKGMVCYGTLLFVRYCKEVSGDVVYIARENVV